MEIQFLLALSLAIVSLDKIAIPMLEPMPRLTPIFGAVASTRMDFQEPPL